MAISKTYYVRIGLLETPFVYFVSKYPSATPFMSDELDNNYAWRSRLFKAKPIVELSHSRLS